jgi:hypothetical protein
MIRHATLPEKKTAAIYRLLRRPCQASAPLRIDPGLQGYFAFYRTVTALGNFLAATFLWRLAASPDTFLGQLLSKGPALLLWARKPI